MSVEIYRAKVTELISQADITTVSARKIRKQIEAFTNSSLDHVKRDFDDMVMEIYEKITDDIERSVLNGTQAPGAQQPPQQHHHHQPHQPHQQQQQQPQTGFVSGFALPPTSYVPPPPPRVAAPAPAPAPSTSDESEDDNSDSDASEASYSSLDEETGRKRKKPQLVKDKSKKKKETQAKSQAATKKLKDKGKKDKKKAEEKAKPKVKRKQAVNEDGTPKVNPFNRPMVISDKLAEVIGQAGSIGPSGRIEMSRPEVVKQLWVYIKANSLQLENDKRVIACDEKLKTLFGQEQVNCFSMNKYLSNHLSKAEELV